MGVSEEELVKLQEDADRREKQLKQQVCFCLSPPTQIAYTTPPVGLRGLPARLALSFERPLYRPTAGGRGHEEASRCPREDGGREAGP